MGSQGLHWLLLQQPLQVLPVVERVQRRRSPMRRGIPELQIRQLELQQLPRRLQKERRDQMVLAALKIRRVRRLVPAELLLLH